MKYNVYSNILYLKFFKYEINEVTYDGINIEVYQKKIYYFYSKIGFENGGIMITNSKCPKDILCVNVDNVKNIYEVDYKNLLNNSNNCIINDNILKYPILEKNSYFIFSLKPNNKFKLNLVDLGKQERKLKEISYNLNHMKNIRKNSEKEYNKTSLICLIISSIILVIYAFILISACTCCRDNACCLLCFFALKIVMKMVLLVGFIYYAIRYLVHH